LKEEQLAQLHRRLRRRAHLAQLAQVEALARRELADGAYGRARGEPRARREPQLLLELPRLLRHAATPAAAAAAAAATAPLRTAVARARRAVALRRVARGLRRVAGQQLGRAGGLL